MLTMFRICKAFLNVRQVWLWIFVRNTTRGFAFCALKLHVCFINTRVALTEFCALVQFICSQGIYVAYSSDILVGCAI